MEKFTLHKITQKEIEKERLKREVFCWLNDDFERKHLSDAAEMFNLKESTIWNYLKEECKLGHVERVRHGVYVKRFDYAQSA